GLVGEERRLAGQHRIRAEERAKLREIVAGELHARESITTRGCASPRPTGPSRTASRPEGRPEPGAGRRPRAEGPSSRRTSTRGFPRLEPSTRPHARAARSHRTPRAAPGGRPAG